MAHCNYHVFLSFRGPDTRDNLVRYLCDRLEGLRMVSFLDSEEIEYGHSIGDVIVDAIERSDICVPVFSPDFATSTACLKEVAQMVKSEKEILPIFFFVKPSDVKHQLGTYEKSFAEHERKRRYPVSIIQDWRNALEKIGDMKGLEFKNAALEVALEAALEKICGTKGPEFKQATLEAALKKIGRIEGTEFAKALEATLEAALEAALKKIADIKGSEFKEAALEGPKFTKAALEAALEKICDIKDPELKKAALEAALEKMCSIKGPEFKKATLEAALEKIGRIKGRPSFAESLEEALDDALKEIADKKVSESKKAALEKIDGTKALKFRKADLEAALEAALDETCITKGPEFTKATLEVALEKIGCIKGPEFAKALEAALEAALRGIANKKGPEFRKAVMDKIDGMMGSELRVMKAALEAALEKIGVTKGPKFTEAVEATLEKIGGITKAAVEAALAKTGGQFNTDLFDGFKELDDFISKIWKLVKMYEQGVPRNLVGIDTDVEEMMQKLGFYYQNGVVKERVMTGRRVLVVWGMPRVGKTTLAKVVFHNIRHLFQGSSSLEDVRHEFEQKKVVSLQNKLIRELRSGGKRLEVESSAEGTKMIEKIFQKKRVLILLDDVDDVEQFKQIKPFAEELTWFGPGSAIILTTTKESVIDFYKNRHSEQNQGNVFSDHKVLPLNEDCALELFYEHACPPDHPPEVYKSWSREITSAVGCHPFAIEMVGRYLRGKSGEHWAGTLERLTTSPERDLRPILMEHYNSLRDNAAQNIFLDIACFFSGVEKTIPYYMWDACGLDPLGSVGRLENMSFLRIGKENEFLMHNQLKLLGREIVKEEAHDNLEECSRLWDYPDVRTILRQMQNLQRTNKVKALRVASDFNRVDDTVFDRLWNLRFLELDNVDISGNRRNILRSLKWLNWRGCKNKSRLLAFDMEDLVILDLCSSSIHLSLTEWGQLMQKAQNLGVLNLKGCTWVYASMEIPASSRLKCLILEGCLHLELNTINSKFENLVSFNMKGCQWVKSLPEALFFMKALKELLIDGTKIEELQFEEGTLPALETLSACHCGELREVTDSIRYLKNLKKLFLRGCRQLNTLPHVFGELGQLQEMDLSNTTISELPPCVGHCKKLQVLKMAPTFIEAFPEAIKDLKELKELDFTDCGSLSGRCDIKGLSSLRILRLKGTEISEVVARDEAQFCLHILELDYGVTKLIPISLDEELCLQT